MSYFIRVPDHPVSALAIILFQARYYICHIIYEKPFQYWGSTPQLPNGHSDRRGCDLPQSSVSKQKSHSGIWNKCPCTTWVVCPQTETTARRWYLRFCPCYYHTSYYSLCCYHFSEVGRHKVTDFDIRVRAPWQRAKSWSLQIQMLFTIWIFQST